ncbi:hypothetical protein CRUP_000316 [Coryphaenoides rupestris]|nr:hypothetical protein CRUP_000316 [Coryphaenoides rupestris]
MEAIYTHGVWVADSLQQKTMDQEKLWLAITHMGDPKAAFLLLFPLTYFIHSRTGVTVLWVAALSEWLNLVLKWMLFGERPFWWIGESRLFVNNHPNVIQFASTCETGPGSPSGHAMVTAAAWWVVASAAGSFLHSRTRRWSLGRSQRPLLFHVASSLGLLLTALLLNVALEKLGLDLSWSITLAKKWCAHAEWIRLDTAPLSSLTRDCGAILGLGLSRYWKPGGWPLPWASRALCLALASMALYHINRFPLPVQPQALFYALFLLKFVLVPQVVMVLTNVM